VRRAAWLALVAAGCNQVLGVTDPHLHDGGALGSDGSGGMTDGSAACAGDGFGYTISNVAPCDIPAAPMMAPLIVNSTIDTTAGTVTVGTSVQPLPASALVPQLVGNQMVRVVSVPGFRVPPGITVNVVGQYGLVLVVRGDVVIDGTVTASADHTTPAAGSRIAAACGASAGAAGTTAVSGAGNTSSGSGGGGHGGSGATGGAATGVLGNPIPGGTGGITDTNPMLRPLRGGCPGGVRAGGVPAAGGGAIQISASGRIDINGTIAAAGGGAVTLDPAVPAPAGGAGGGILLEAGTIALTANAAVTANGGAGADGADKVSACSGENGHLRNDTPAAGGSCNGSTDITGGAGGTRTALAHGGDTGARGTGGGGGVGRIAIHSHTFTQAMGSVVSPLPNTEPF
jgi:hypothetical protein